MTYRESANESSALVRPPQILGFAFYVLGTGCVASGLAQLALFAENIHVATLAPLPSWAFVIGQVMVLVGLVIGWRATTGHQRRLLGVAATLWLTLFVVEMQRGRSSAASLVGRAIVLLVVAVVVHGSGRAFASRTWATTLGAMLVFADAWAGAWPILTHAGFRAGTARLLHATPSMAAAGIGLLLVGGGLYVAGRAILRGVTIEEYVRAHPKGGRADDSSSEVSTSGVRRGLPLFAEGLTAIAGLALAHAASVAVATRVGLSMHDVSDTTTLGGELVAWTVVVVALHRMRPLTKQPLGFAIAVLGAVVLEVLLRYLRETGTSGRTVLRGRDMLRTRLRLAASILGGSLVFSFFAPDMAGSGVLLFVQAFAVLLGALALYAAIAAAGQARRIEIQLPP